MSTFRHQPSQLRYLNVANSLRQKIRESAYLPGQRLPRQQDLAKEYNVAFNTLKQALDVLEREGYLVRKLGQGTYAALPGDSTPAALIVDDEPGVRRLFTRTLAKHGWAVVSAASGVEALAILQEQRFDLIFLDLVLPGMNGPATFKEIRCRDPEAHVVLVTAYPDPTLMSEALQAGPFAVMRKPFTLQELQIVINSVPGARLEVQADADRGIPAG